MSDETRNLMPEQEDPGLHRLLASLPSHAPSPGFEDRVLSRVYRPAPAWVRSLQGNAPRAFDTRKVRMWLGALVVSSAVSTVVLALVARAYWVQLETTWSTFSTGLVLGTWRQAIAVSADVVVYVSRTVAQWNLTGPGALAIAAGTVALLGVSAWGLRHTMRQFHLERVAPNAHK